MRVPAVRLPTSSRGLGPQRRVSLVNPVRRMSRKGRLEQIPIERQTARTNTRKDNKIQLTHMQKRRNLRLKAVMTNEEDNQIEGNGVKGDQNETQIKSSTHLAKTSYRQQGARTHPCKDNKIQLTHMQKRRNPRLKAAMANEKDNGVDQNKT
ncbi:hypothetical protein G2W53_037000 [Senna tora]|uniref:Uncharacterized protein n=1 Tax=Senna tora TaxID=362788 RepID=A0A834SYF3_9FABA|nr:hypothetical protein G2W53_037000 [Senna tora]